MIPRNLPAPYQHSEADVIVTEGEKAATAAADKITGNVVVTTHHGGANQAHLTHWGHLAKRRVTLFPDHDEPSVSTWVPALSQVLHDVGVAEIRVVDVDELWRRCA